VTTAIAPGTTHQRTDDHDSVAHLITATDQLRAFVHGQAVAALCGKVWVPSHQPPPGTPPCKPCHRLHAAIFGT
jgi:hypothetical protein